jgi:VWFA-related protein
MRGAAVGLLAVVYLSLSVQAQQSAPPEPAPPLAERPSTAEPAEGRRISIDVVVTDKSGAPISGLQQQDFSLLDDKQPQKVASFAAFDDTNAATAPPQQLIFVIDSVNTSYMAMGMARQQLGKFLHDSGPQLPVPASFVFFTETSTQMQPHPSRDTNELAGFLSANEAGFRAVGRAAGFYGAAERLQLSIRALGELVTYESKQPGRKLVIWISPGWALLSGVRVEITSKQQDMLFNTVVQLSGQLRQARMTLYSVDPLGMSDAASGRTFYYQEFLKGVPSARKVENGNLALQVLAAQSGGRVLNSSNDIAKLVASCVTDVKAYYTLSFDAPRADHANEFHSLGVAVAKPGLTARTRMGYYAQP